MKDTTEGRRRRWQFFQEHGGTIVGESARVALELARAEELLDEAEEIGAAVSRWEDDPEPYEHGEMTDAEVAAEFEAGRWTGPYACVVETLDARGRPAAVSSLSGITLGPNGIGGIPGAGDPYARVVRAELADEIAIELEAAIARRQVVELAAELAERIGDARARLELRGVLDAIEQEAGR